MTEARASIIETARKRSGCGPRIPRADKRGLGLADAMLAVIVLGVLGTMGWQIASGWIDRKLLASEGRALAELARAGRLWVEGDSGRAPTGSTPVAVDVSDLVTAGLRDVGDPTRTPARRDMTLWLRADSNDRILVLARARGDAPHANRYTPDAIDGVPGLGVLLDLNENGTLEGDETRLRGPDVTLDFTGALGGIAAPGDLFALAHVFTSAAACPHPYLSRDDPACDTMATPLNMGGQTLTGLTSLDGITLQVGEITGAVTVPGTLTVTDDVVVGGNVVAEGNVTAGTVQTNRIFAGEGDFDQLTVDDLTARSCDGC